MQIETLKQLIESGLPGSEVTIDGDGTHFNALIICPTFANQSRIKRQQMVYDTVRTHLLDGSLHALSLKTLTPAEWQAIEKEEGF